MILDVFQMIIKLKKEP